MKPLRSHAFAPTIQKGFCLCRADADVYHSCEVSLSSYLAQRAMDEIPFEKLSGSFDFDLEMLVLARVRGLRVTQLPIPTIYADEVSHLNPIQYGFDVLSVVWDYKRGKYHKL